MSFSVSIGVISCKCVSCHSAVQRIAETADCAGFVNAPIHSVPELCHHYSIILTVILCFLWKPPAKDYMTMICSIIPEIFKSRTQHFSLSSSLKQQQGLLNFKKSFPWGITGMFFDLLVSQCNGDLWSSWICISVIEQYNSSVAFTMWHRAVRGVTPCGNIYFFNLVGFIFGVKR